MRRYGFYYRYDTHQHLGLLNEFWGLVCDRLNFFTPAMKPIDYATDTVGRRKRVYDAPKTPYRRLLLDAQVLSPAQAKELTDYKDSLNVVTIAREIDRIQQRLTSLAAAPTRRLEREIEDAHARALPEADWIKFYERKAS